VHTVRPNVVADDRGYAALLAALPRLRTLELDAVETVDALAELGAQLAITRLEIRDARRRTTFDLPSLIERAVAIAPALRELVLPPAFASADVCPAFSGSVLTFQ
jgi:hypothetical protein